MIRNICRVSRYALVAPICLSAVLLANGQGVLPGAPPVYPGLKDNPLDKGPLPLRPRPPVPPVIVPPGVIVPRPVVIWPGMIWTYPLSNLFGGDSDSDTKKPDNAYSSTSPSNDKPLATTAFPGHESILRGLLDVKPGEVHVKAADVINVRAKMRDKEVQTLIQSVNANRKLFQNAETLSARLQEIGLLHAGDRVVGYAGGKVYAVVSGAR
jgi:hypothetical protein